MERHEWRRAASARWYAHIGGWRVAADLNEKVPARHLASTGGGAARQQCSREAARRQLRAAVTRLRSQAAAGDALVRTQPLLRPLAPPLLCSSTTR
jgi:hypothetical protein